MSNPKWFRFEDVWDKKSPTGHLNAKKMPLRRHESVLLFSPSTLGNFAYNPLMRTGELRQKGTAGRQSQCYGRYKRLPVVNDQYYPTSIIGITKTNYRGTLHPTQKPVALFEYLIRTYSNAGDLVLDNTMGSGTTGVACLNTGRRFIGIEKDPEIYATAQKRITDHAAARAAQLLPA